MTDKIKLTRDLVAQPGLILTLDGIAREALENARMHARVDEHSHTLELRATVGYQVLNVISLDRIGDAKQGPEEFITMNAENVAAQLRRDVFALGFKAAASHLLEAATFGRIR
ncbi:hypothetical protein [Pseudolysinimonas sp.]|uniref:hypothetical protein n=1 Tax=Pseudolysinimonas sp. TaxID=2680009 RepID=UPI003F802289